MSTDATAARPARTPVRHVVAQLADAPEGSNQEVVVEGRSFALINDQGRFFAVRNVCPHHGAPLCFGRVQGYMLPSEPHTYDYSGDDEQHRVLLCPWHGYKFRLADGRSVTDPDRMRVRSYEVHVEGDDVVLYL